MEYPDTLIQAVVTIQNRFRFKRNCIINISTELRFIYSIIFSSMTRINDSFTAGIISQNTYNKYLHTLQNILFDFKSVQRLPTLMNFKI